MNKLEISALPRSMAVILMPLLVMTLVSACARTVVMDDCDFPPALFAQTANPEDFRFYVLATPPVRDAANPGIDIESIRSGGGSRHYHLSLERLESNAEMKTYYGAVDADLWRRYRLSAGSKNEFQRLQADIAAHPTGTERLRLTASVIRSSQSNIRELRIRNDPTGRNEAICRL
jgi:hypothetical protein